MFPLVNEALKQRGPDDLLTADSALTTKLGKPEDPSRWRLRGS